MFVLALLRKSAVPAPLGATGGRPRPRESGTSIPLLDAGALIENRRKSLRLRDTQDVIALKELKRQSARGPSGDTLRA